MQSSITTKLTEDALYNKSDPLKAIFNQFFQDQRPECLKIDQCKKVLGHLIEQSIYSDYKLENFKNLITASAANLSQNKTFELLNSNECKRAVSSLVVLCSLDDYLRRYQKLISFFVESFSDNKVFELINNDEFKKAFADLISIYGFTEFFYDCNDYALRWKAVLKLFIREFSKDKVFVILESNKCKKAFVDLICNSALNNDKLQLCKDLIGFFIDTFSKDQALKIFDHNALSTYLIDPCALTINQVKEIIRSEEIFSELKNEICTHQKILPIVQHMLQKDPELKKKLKDSIFSSDVPTLIQSSLSCYVGKIACNNPDKTIKDVYKMSFDKEEIPTKLEEMVLNKVINPAHKDKDELLMKY